MQAGDIYRHEDFYRDPRTGTLAPKYLLFLARTPSDDLVARLLTSRPHGRPESPPCFHGNPYPGFYLGYLGGALSAKSWVDLRKLDDIDFSSATRRKKEGVMQLVLTLEQKRTIDVLECAAGADDTTRQQEKSMRDELAIIRGSVTRRI